MGSSERRKREREALRAKILGAARELFVAEGYEAVTLRRIAEKIEYSTTAIYAHFKDKKSLIEAITHEDFATHARLFATCASIEDPMERLRRCGQLYIEFAVKYPKHYQLMFMREHTEEREVEKPTSPEENSYEFLVSIVRDCIATGRFRDRFSDPGKTAQILWAAVHGVAALYVALGHVEKFAWNSPEKLGDHIMDAVLIGMIAPDSKS